MKQIYTTFIRSVLETSCSVWHKILTRENEIDLERIQKSAFRVILGDKYISFENALYALDMEILKNWRESLFTTFTLKSLQVKHMNTILKENMKTHTINTRTKVEQLKIDHTNTEQLRNSAGILMQITANRNWTDI